MFTCFVRLLREMTKLPIAAAKSDCLLECPRPTPAKLCMVDRNESSFDCPGFGVELKFGEVSDG